MKPTHLVFFSLPFITTIINYGKNIFVYFSLTDKEEEKVVIIMVTYRKGSQYFQ